MGAMTTRAKPHKRPSLPLGTPTRRAAMRLLDAVLRRGEALETALPAATRDLVSPPDRGLAHAIAAETLRRLLDLDALIDSATRQRLPDDAKARMALRIALAQTLALGTPPHAAIATVLPGTTLPLRTPHSKPVGKISLSITRASSSTPSGMRYRLVSACGIRTYSACVPSI